MCVKATRTQMVTEDGRLLTIYEMLEDRKDIPEIMEKLNLSQRRVYQLIARCREIVKGNFRQCTTATGTNSSQGWALPAVVCREAKSAV